MEKIILDDNTVNSYIPIAATKPALAYLPKEESLQSSYRDHNYDGVNNIPQTSTADTWTEINAHKANLALGAAGPTFPINAANSATDYIGAVKIDVPHIINDLYTDFKLIDTYTNDILTIAGTTLEQVMEELYPANDTNPKAISVFNGLQALRIPANRFNDNTVTPTVYKHGTYYIKVCPKYIQTEILSFLERKHVDWLSVNPSDAEGRRKVTRISNVPFANTPWDFNNSFSNKQRGRLQGSVVEIWDSSGFTKKQTKFIVEDSLDFTSGTTGLFVLSPDNVGYDSPFDVPVIGDKLRVFPRETYFNPIFIEVSYQNGSNNIMDLVRFMKNDVTRDLRNGIFEVYDDAGVTVDPQGNINGNVIMSYQIQQIGYKEVRKKIII